MFTTSRPFLLFDYFRVPYRAQPTGGPDFGLPRFLAQAVGEGTDGAQRRLLWLVADECPADRCPSGFYALGDLTLVGRVAPDAEVRRGAARTGVQWEPAEEIRDEGGLRAASVWRTRAGDVLLPFDPGQVAQLLWSEGYQRVGGRRAGTLCRQVALRGYYLVRPALPRPLQLALRRAFTRVQSRRSFPRWPVEDTLHDLYAWLFGVLTDLTGRPVPVIGPWPGDRSWALVLTHDVETAAGLRDIELLRGPERALGYRSSWNLVGERYQVDDATIDRLRADGCEIGVHGLRHDGRDLRSLHVLADRLPRMHRWAQRWGAVGFRAPATQRRWEWMPRLGFRYDSSYTDTDPYEPQPGGCCSYLPFHNQQLVAVPLTPPQDHTLFALLGHRDGALWLRKARHIRDRHGMALVLAHPDYAADPCEARAWGQLLEEFHADPTAWRALPHEVADWWQRRAASSLEPDGDGWRIV